jgi:hypothetical protein
MGSWSCFMMTHFVAQCLMTLSSTLLRLRRCKLVQLVLHCAHFACRGS